jgi:hypothetical protein
MSASAFACTNFSGEYYDEMDGTYFSMTQDSCNSITYQYEEGPVMRPTDSKDYLVNDYDIVVEEGKVLAHVKIFSSNEFKDEKLVSHDRSEITYTSGGVEIEKVWSETSLDKNNDMVIISHAEDGTKEKTVNKRVK